jgi:hypothetical protein
LIGVGVTGEWSGITTLVQICLLLRKKNYSIPNFSRIYDLGQASLDMRATDYLVVTTLNSVYIHNKEMAVVQINRDQITDSKPTFLQQQ